MRNIEAWGSVPFYVVGQGTAAALAEIQHAHKCTLDIRGGSSGTSEHLARFIVDDLRSTSTGKLLYLTGDKNRDVLPTILHENGIELFSLQVYKTQGSPTFEQLLSDAISGPLKGKLSLIFKCCECNGISLIREQNMVDRLLCAVLSRIRYAYSPKIL